MLKNILIVLFVLSSLAGGFLLYLVIKNKNHLPATFPQKGAKNISPKTKKRLLCLGDSNTHGLVGHDWVSEVAAKLPDYEIINAGRNSDLTFTLLDRIDDVVACQPDLVVMLIGTNDVNATMSEKQRQHYVDSDRIKPNDFPNQQNFEGNYHQLVSTLKKQTKAQIALMSLPLMSEDLGHEANQRADDYSDLIYQIAQTKDVNYLSIREIQKDYLSSHPSKPINNFDKTYSMLSVAVFLNQVLGWSWNKISAYHGFSLTTDNLHQNEVAGGMIRDEVLKFVVSEANKDSLQK